MKKREKFAYYCLYAALFCFVITFVTFMVALGIFYNLPSILNIVAGWSVLLGLCFGLVSIGLLWKN